MRYTIKNIEDLNSGDSIYFKSPNNGKIIIQSDVGDYSEDEILEIIGHLPNGFIDANSGFNKD